MSVTLRQLHSRPAWTAPADEWAPVPRARMVREGYQPNAIIDKLQAYGCGLFAAQRIVREALANKGG